MFALSKLRESYLHSERNDKVWAEFIIKTGQYLLDLITKEDIDFEAVYTEYSGYASAALVVSKQKEDYQGFIDQLFEYLRESKE